MFVMSLFLPREGTHRSSKKTTHFCLGHRVPSTSLWDSSKDTNQVYKGKDHDAADGTL